MFNRMHNYPVGSEVQAKTGHVKKKISDGKWQGRNRWVAEKKIVKRELHQNERVFHINGKKDDDGTKNLVIITFSMTKFILPKSQVIFIPK